MTFRDTGPLSYPSLTLHGPVSVNSNGMRQVELLTTSFATPVASL